MYKKLDGIDGSAYQPPQYTMALFVSYDAIKSLAYVLRLDLVKWFKPSKNFTKAQLQLGLIML